MGEKRSRQMSICMGKTIYPYFHKAGFGKKLNFQRLQSGDMWKTENVFCLIIPSITGSQTIWGGDGYQLYRGYYL